MIVLPLSTPQNHDLAKSEESSSIIEGTTKKWIVEPVVNDVKEGAQSAIKASLKASVIAD